MNPDDIKTIYQLLANRVRPESALEGDAIMQLARRFVAHFAPPVPPPVASTTIPNPPA